MDNDEFLPFPTWQEQSKKDYPTQGVFYNWTRPGPTRDELIKAGVLARFNGRWLFNYANFQRHLSNP